jgi:rhodanese-related sulfurtransferase
MASAGTAALELAAGLFALYILGRWWRRQRLLRALRMARITVEELNQAIVAGLAPIVVDVRSATNRQLDTRVIPGALLADLGGIDQAVHEIPLDRELVIYCSCPNEVSAARAAKALMAQGYRHVRPLRGGLDAWDAAGYVVERLVLANDGASAAAGGAVRATI